eukprot:7497463-Pyramimonas_sp.AAC.1
MTVRTLCFRRSHGAARDPAPRHSAGASRGGRRKALSRSGPVGLSSRSRTPSRREQSHDGFCWVPNN